MRLLVDLVSGGEAAISGMPVQEMARKYSRTDISKLNTGALPLLLALLIEAGAIARFSQFTFCQKLRSGCTRQSEVLILKILHFLNDLQYHG